MGIIVVCLLSYLIGSIPSGYIAGRIAGIDIRTVGSGNIGATNVTRMLGKKYGYPVFLADFGKGLASVLLAGYIGRHYVATPSVEVLQVTAGVFCVLGNTYPVWLNFRGGKGVATSAGLLFGLVPIAAIAAILIWLVTFQISRYVSLASVIAAGTLPLSVWVTNRFLQSHGTLLLCVSTALAAVVIFRHRSNLARLRRGTETRFDRREKD